MICEICRKDFSSLRGLHGHVSKAHKYTTGDYYHTFFPRYDLGTKELINYKTYEQYHESDFNSRDSFSDWLSENYKTENAKKYCLEKTKKRIADKNLKSLPGQAELKSILLPSISGFERIYGNLKGFISEMSKEGIPTKFDYSCELQFDNSDFLIYMDTREQRPLLFDHKIENMKLSCGDYTCSQSLYSDVYIERKSLADLAGTLSAGKERFQREIERAKDLGFYLVVVVEDTYSNAVHYSPSNSFAKKLTGAHLLHEVRDIMTNYSNIQFVFSGTRARASTLIENIFRLKGQAKILDLEFLKDKGLI